MKHLLMAAAQQQGGGGGDTTVYVEEDFTATTTGDLSDNNLAVDELSGGWLGAEAVDFAYDASGSGVTTSAGLIKLTVVQTDGREDVQVTSTVVPIGGTSTNRWSGWAIRGTGTGDNSPLTLRFDGLTTAPNLVLIDGAWNGTVMKTWDLSVLTTPPVDGDTVKVVASCSGNNITLVSLQVNGGGVETIDDTYTLTGAAATNHGAGSGADYYGLYAGRPGTGSFYEDFKVETIPA